MIPESGSKSSGSTKLKSQNESRVVPNLMQSRTVLLPAQTTESAYAAAAESGAIAPAGIQIVSQRCAKSPIFKR